jgi:hypothetical protein
MLSSAVRAERRKPESSPAAETKVDAFARDLSELGRKYGLGITGQPTLFVMEPVDYQLEYCVDGESKLSLR